MRFFTATSWGTDRQLLRIGGPDTYRGQDYGDLGGSSVAAATLEARFPIFPGTELLRGVIFYDAATTWGHGTVHGNELLPRSLSPFDLDGNDIFTAVGVGLRGYVGLPLRFDAALPQDGLNRWRTFFSIGFDF